MYDFDMWNYALTATIPVSEGKNGVHETLSWGTRVRIVLESAQGMIKWK